MKIITLLILICFIPNFLFAQQVSKASLDNEAEAVWYSFKNNSNIINVQNYKEKGDYMYTVTVLDENLEKIKSTEFEDRKEDVLRHVTFNDGKLYFLLEENTKSDLQIKFHLNIIDIEDFSKTGKTLVVINEKDDSNVIRRFFKVNGDNASFGIVNFRDDYVAISYELRNESVKERVSYLFDKNYNQIFKKEKEYSIEDRDERFRHYSSDIGETNETLYVLNNTPESNTYKLEAINGESYTSKNIVFDKEGHRDLTLVKTKNGLYCVGFFNDEKNENGAIFYSKFSDDLEIVSEEYLPFSDNFYDDLNKKQVKRGVLLSLFDVIDDDNGSLYIIGEVNRVDVAGRDAQGFNNLNAINDDVIACKLDKDGTLNWSRLVNKSQKFYYSQYASFKPFIIDNKLHYVFNSEFDIEDVKTDKKSNSGMQPGSAQKFNVYLVSFNDEGIFEHQQLTDKKEDLRYLPVNSHLIKNESLTMPGSRKKENGLLRVQF